jgi:hypothetical protein
MDSKAPKEVSIYVHHGLHKNVAESLGQELTERFTHNPANGTGKGYFLGVEFLRDLVADLDAGHFDGLLMSFGEAPPEDGANVATQVVFKNAHTDQLDYDRQGMTYVSVNPGGTEPSSLGSPPL